MDYKELIDTMRGYSTADIISRSRDAATAIETMLAEREAFIAQIRGQCGLCANRQRCISDEGLKRDCAVGNRRYWKWRGLTPPDRESD